MPAYAINDVLEVIQVGHIYGVEVQNRIHVRCKRTYTGAVEAAGWFKDRITFDLAGASTSQLTWTTLKIRRIHTTGPEDYEVVPIGAVAGRTGGVPLPLQMCLLFTLRVKGGGFPRDGRIYNPAVPAGAWSGNAYNAGSLLAYNDLAAGLFAKYKVGGTDNAFVWLVKCKHTTGYYEYRPIEGVTFRTWPAVQRRRRISTVA